MGRKKAEQTWKDFEQQRNRTKRIAYACVYGTGAKALAKDLEVTEEGSAKYLHGFFYKFPKIRDFKYGEYMFSALCL